ncbi:hypothetical protein AB0J35_05530 [Nonomuraea angiospora]|uniref:hypothetical protein n=1 Tax=Nonomuraea angiospora TaxID=46172 RepID=UPI003443C6E8
MISIAGPTVLPGRPPYSVEDLFTFPEDGNRFEPDEGVLYVHELNGDTYGPPTAYGAGTSVTLSASFPVSLDPAELIKP